MSENNVIEVSQGFGDNFNVKISQEFGEKLKINPIHEDPREYLNVKLINQEPQKFSINEIYKPIKVDIIGKPKDDFIYYESKELSINGKSLITLGIVGIIYGMYDIKINSLLGLTIKDSNNHLPGVIGVLTIVECIIFTLIFFRDFYKDFVDKKIISNKNLKDIEDLRKLINNNHSENDNKNILIRIQESENKNSDINLQNYQKNTIYYGLKVIYPLSIGLIGICSIGREKIIEIILKIPLEYTIIPITLTIVIILMNKLKGRKETHTK